MARLRAGGAVLRSAYRHSGASAGATVSATSSATAAVFTLKTISAAGDRAGGVGGGLDAVGRGLDRVEADDARAGGGQVGGDRRAGLAEAEHRDRRRRAHASSRERSRTIRSTSCR